MGPGGGEGGRAELAGEGRDLGSSPVVCHSITSVTPPGARDCTHFVDEGTEAQRGEATWLREGHRPGKRPGQDWNPDPSKSLESGNVRASRALRGHLAERKALGCPPPFRHSRGRLRGLGEEPESRGAIEALGITWIPAMCPLLTPTLVKTLPMYQTGRSRPRRGT